MRYCQSLLLPLAVLITFCAYAQTNALPAADTAAILTPSLSAKYLNNISSKASKLEQKLDKKSDKALRQMMKMEIKMKEKLAKINPDKAKEIFGNAEQKYKELEQRLKKELPLQQYIASLDSLSTSMKFLQQNP